MYAMRDPVHAASREGEGGWIPCPSLSGIAFAGVAAALPLLASNDVDTNTGTVFVSKRKA